jgi:hypothetical protein
MSEPKRLVLVAGARLPGEEPFPFSCRVYGLIAGELVHIPDTFRVEFDARYNGPATVFNMTRDSNGRLVIEGGRVKHVSRRVEMVSLVRTGPEEPEADVPHIVGR